MSWKKIGLGVVLLAVAGGVGAYAWATRHPELEAIAPPGPDAFDQDAVDRGEALASLGNCGVCHTVEGNPPFAGGLALPTPFGTIYTTNITPAPETGIGRWSEAAFARAMREGVDRGGQHLYPAFPYDYYTKVSDADLNALYAFLMTREPVEAEPRQNDLTFPFNMRPLLSGWKLLFHDPGAYRPDADRDEEWNRGAYLVEGLGHCGACHTPRNPFGAAPKDGPDRFAGGEAEGWYAPPLNDAADDPVPWTLFAMVDYLIDGWHADHGIAAGPMRPVVDEIYFQPEDEAFAMATYLLSLRGDRPSDEDQSARAQAARSAAEQLNWGHPDAPEVPDDPTLQAGAAVFERECSECHAEGEETVPLALTPGVHAPLAGNLIAVSLWGINPAPQGSLDRSMPARHTQISDDEMAALAAFVRDRFSDRPAWNDLEQTVAEVRANGRH